MQKIILKFHSNYKFQSCINFSDFNVKDLFTTDDLAKSIPVTSTRMLVKISHSIFGLIQAPILSSKLVLRPLLTALTFFKVLFN